MQKQLDLLLEKYAVNTNAQLVDNLTVNVDGKNLALLPWRSERRFTELKKLITDGQINGISVMRTLRIVQKGADLFDEILREFDINQYILGSNITEIFAIGDENHAINIIAKTKDDYICTLEISATLAQGTDIIDKHEIISLSGVACDRAADTQIPQSSIYVYGQEQVKYTDVDAELFGLSVDECAVVRSAFEIAKTKQDLSGEVNNLNKLIAAVKKSLDTMENVLVEG